MDISIKTSLELSPKEWLNYTNSFNEVFEKNFNQEDFKRKYLKTVDNLSYHSILKSDTRIVGSCSVIPYNYIIENKIVKVGLAVDVFIIEKFRSDPLTLFRMYKKLRKRLISEDVKFILAVPNDIVYSYWKNVVKWKDIGCLDYYIFPVYAGNIVKKLVNPLNIISKNLSTLSVFISQIFNGEGKEFPLRMERNNTLINEHRYTSNHKLINNDNVFFSYAVVEEKKGIKASYIIDFWNKSSGKKDSYSLRKAIKYIRQTESIDLIIFVGKISFSQLLLFKIPRALEPKRLNLTIDVFMPEDFRNPDSLYNIRNWDFGLLNYDVR